MPQPSSAGDGIVGGWEMAPMGGILVPEERLHRRCNGFPVGVGWETDVIDRAR